MTNIVRLQMPSTRQIHFRFSQDWLDLIELIRLSKGFKSSAEAVRLALQEYADNHNLTAAVTIPTTPTTTKVAIIDDDYNH